MDRISRDHLSSQYWMFHTGAAKKRRDCRRHLSQVVEKFLAPGLLVVAATPWQPYTPG
jgi:hypothetical protein